MSAWHGTDVMPDGIVEVRNWSAVLTFVLQLTGHLRRFELVKCLALPSGAHRAVASRSMSSKPLSMLLLLLCSWDDSSGAEGPSD